MTLGEDMQPHVLHVLMRLACADAALQDSASLGVGAFICLVSEALLQDLSFLQSESEEYIALAL